MSDEHEVERNDLDPGVWRRIGAGLTVAGRATYRGFAHVGRAASRAYRSVDPDVRRHVGQLPIVGLSMLSSRDETFAPLPDDGATPLVCLHGFGGHRGNFLGLKMYLRAHGRRRTYAVGLSRARTLDEMVEAARRATAEVISVNELGEDGRVDWLAHSMGGVVARLALADEATARRVRTLVTLGTPHRGTYLARYAYTDTTLALRPDSDVIAALNDQLPWPGPPSMPRLVAFWSRADVMIIPPELAHVEGAEAIELQGMTHYDYLIQPRTFARIMEMLEERGRIQVS